jgi:50S ribosomal protein L16 3-hydroxylase
MTTLLGGLSPACFLRDYWHKRPLLVRNAIPGFNGLLSPAEMQTLAARDDVESRLIRGSGIDWQLEHGPFRRADFKRLPKTDWTLLVQSLNHIMPEADALLARFNFIPHARLDDLMVSYAVAGGSVGPHFDSYDVFLLQGHGHRRWQISAQAELDLIDDLPLKILRRFTPQQEWVLGPGDMLYLPPQYAHHGVAESDCTTYSIGFRAPMAHELAHAFLDHLQDTLHLTGRYADPDLKPHPHPASISRVMIDQIEAMIAKIQWTRADVTAFTGVYLTEPKPEVFFDPPDDALSLVAFGKRATRHGVALDLKTRMLFYRRQFFINGDSLDASTDDMAALKCLADQRRLAAPFSKTLLPCLYGWYSAGWLGFDEAP